MLKLVASDGEALSRSASVTMPTSSPRWLTTGKRRMCSLCIRSSASGMDVSGRTVMTGLDMRSPTNIGLPPIENKGNEFRFILV